MPLAKNIRLPPKNDSLLAEFIGIILGDGHIEDYSKTGNANIDIVGHLYEDRIYLENHVSKIIKTLFNIDPRYRIFNKNNGLCIRLQSIKVVKFLKNSGLKPGNKIKNKQGIPKWVFNNKKILSCCIRGLFDTDGSVYLCGNGTLLPRIGLECHNKILRKDIRKALLILGYHPFKSWVLNKRIAIYRKQDVVKYLSNVGFRNQKHIKKFDILCPDRLARSNSQLREDYG